MKRLAPILAAVLLCAGPARAAETAASAPEAPAQTPEPAVEVLTVEDEGARIDELRVRGEPQRVTVRTKGPLRSQYEIAVPRRGGNGALAGQRVWHVLSF